MSDVLPACICVHRMCAWCHGGQKAVSISLHWSYGLIVSLCIGAVDQTQGSCKSRSVPNP